MESSIHTILREYGLETTEIDIYLFLVGNNGLSAYRISKELAIHRSTTYDVLERLMRKGFVTKFSDGKHNLFSANDPSILMSNLRSKESLLESLSEQIKLMNFTKTSQVRIFEGDHAQKHYGLYLFNLLREEKLTYVYCLSNGPTTGPVITTNTTIFLEQLLRKIGQHQGSKIDYKGIWDERFRGSEMVNWYDRLGPNRFLPSLPTKVTTIIHDHGIALMYTTDKPNTIEIQNSLVAEEMKAYFLKIWEIADGKLNNKRLPRICSP